jgi:crotonobetainyl-CoA:carnitine CoA-transferase CaiB-like acyl-CoA transferase
VYPAVVATSAVLAALLARVTTGRGDHLDVAMGQAAFYVNDWAATDLQPPVEDFGGFDTWNQYTYRLGDGSSVALVGNPVNLFPLWVRSFGGDEALLTDSRFATPAARAAHVEEMNEVVEGLTYRFSDFASLEASIDDPWMLAAPVRSTAAFAATDWATERGLTTEVAPGLPVPAAPWQSSETTIGVPTSVSALGADNRAVLVEAGYANDEIDDLTRAGVLRDGSDAASTTGRPDAT